MNCHVCFNPLVPVQGCEGTEVQFENALIVHFSGGYGMFVDPVWEPLDRVIICHDCAHNLCAVVPWIRWLLNPEGSHSHTKEYRISRPTHYGPDYQ